VSKLEEDSGSRASMLIVRQLSEREALETCWIMDMLVGGYGFEGWRGRGSSLRGRKFVGSGVDIEVEAVPVC